MNEIEKIKDETEKIKRELWALSNETIKNVISQLQQINLTSINSQISSLSNQLNNFNSRIENLENLTTADQKILIFDKDNEDHNYGFDNGLYSGNSITNSAIANCDYFKFYLVSGEYQNVITVSAPTSTDPQSFYLSHNIPQNSRAYSNFFIKFASTMDSIEFVDLSYFYFTGSTGTTAKVIWYDVDTYLYGYIKKIEGFIK